MQHDRFQPGFARLEQVMCRCARGRSIDLWREKQALGLRQVDGAAVVVELFLCVQVGDRVSHLFELLFCWCFQPCMEKSVK